MHELCYGLSSNVKLSTTPQDHDNIVEQARSTGTYRLPAFGTRLGAQCFMSSAKSHENVAICETARVRNTSDDLKFRDWSTVSVWTDSIIAESQSTTASETASGLIAFLSLLRACRHCTRKVCLGMTRAQP